MLIKLYAHHLQIFKFRLKSPHFSPLHTQEAHTATTRDHAPASSVWKEKEETFIVVHFFVWSSDISV